MLDVYLFALGPLLPLLAGFVLLWVVSLTRRPTADASPNIFRIILTVIGWVLLILGILGTVALMTHYFFLFAWLAMAIILASAVHRYRNAERQSLLWILSAAAERGIPLETAARAFAGERDDHIGVRAVMLSEFLEAGVPLSLALRRSQHPLPPAALLAADLGQETGMLGPALRKVVKQLDEYELTLRWAVEKLLYLGFLVLFTTGILLFLMLEIVPVFAMMLHEIEMEAPVAMRWLIDVTQSFAEGWPVLFPLLAVLSALLLIALLYYVGLSPRNLPVIRRLWWRVDCALILRWMAVAVRQKRPIADFMRLLASYFPQPGLRAKLERSARRIGKGVHWCDALQRAGVIRRAECSILKSAERAGNLAWALDEMADSSLRRSAYRMRAFVSAAFPIVLLIFASCVLAIATGIFLPLLSLISGMA